MLTKTIATQAQQEQPSNEELMEYAKSLGFGELHTKIDSKTGLHGIIAIHSTKLGPSLGGCRLFAYPTYNAAVRDVLRLAQAMSYKAALAGLPLGGGKSVIIKPDVIVDRTALFKSFGRFVNDLGGRYITAVDVGTSEEDMDTISEVTRYVSCTSQANLDASFFTAMGVTHCIEAAVRFKLGKTSLKGLHIAIQGVGHVGTYIAKNLHERGATLTVTDTSAAAIEKCVKLYNAKAVKPEDIYQTPCEVFTPCALGAVINDKTIPQFKTGIIIGAANNQLAEPRHGEELRKRDILYGPDYVVNAGGLIYAFGQYSRHTKEEILKHVEKIYSATLNIFERAKRENRPTNEIADSIGEEMLQT